LEGVKKMLYPDPRAMNFTRSSVWPWFGSKLIGAWKSLASIPCALGRTGSFCAAEINATSATSSTPKTHAKVRFAAGMNYLRRSQSVLKEIHAATGAIYKHHQ
jgi:hypothetical protein